MKTYNFEINSKPNKEGLYNIMLRITESRKHKRIKTDVYIKREDYNSKATFGYWIQSTNQNYIELNAMLINIYINIEKVPVFDTLVQIDKWIDECELQADIFKLNRMEVSMITSEAMAHAYKNVRRIIKVDSGISNDVIIELAKIESNNDDKHKHIKLGYQDGIYYGFIDGFLKAIDVLNKNKI